MKLTVALAAAIGLFSTAEAMREIVSLQGGQCGNQIGAKFWEVISDEHGIDPSGTYRGDGDLQLERINAYFSEATGGRYVPRSVLVDLEPSAKEDIRSGNNLFRPDNFVFGKEKKKGINWAKEAHAKGAKALSDQFKEMSRAEKATVQRAVEGVQCDKCRYDLALMATASGAGLAKLDTREVVRATTACYRRGGLEVSPRDVEANYNALCRTAGQESRRHRMPRLKKGESDMQAYANGLNKDGFGSYFVEWIPNNIKSDLCGIPSKGLRMATTFLGHSTAIKQMMERVGEQFTAMFRRKAFLHWYEGEGMDEMEFTEAESNMNDLVSEYQQYQDAVAE